MERSFFERSPVDVAPELLGSLLTVGAVTMRIVEVEAYLGPYDQAAHSYSGRPTKRTAPMFGPAGHIYVYFTYGMHHCLNIVCGESGQGYAVLLRGAEIISGHDLIATRRFAKPYATLTKTEQKNLVNGPAKLCQAFGLTTADSAVDVYTDSRFQIEAGPAGTIVQTTRIGIPNAGEATAYPWRFYEEGSSGVSKK
ncbi:MULTISPECIES: DNA-3-methyladenine glycosylase [Exiguobacterium]|uniref:DNA-3-methyladenine glycosylase n=1 Tax=Exiguobacterium TaxID=33986 RepID=UPI000550D3BB|nr:MULTISPECIES: DNA-3-methyladenine glycosylase [Exiguobacterium]MCT4778721.1 DNA-3-methyladenine glycosylase [Exiguobacterium soli]